MAKNNKTAEKPVSESCALLISSNYGQQSFLYKDKLNDSVGKAQVIRAPRKMKCLGKN